MARQGRPNKSDPRVDNLSYDIRDGENENVKKILSEVGLDALDGYKRTSLIWTSFYNNTELLKWLIDNGANINHQDRNGFWEIEKAVKVYELPIIVVYPGYEKISFPSQHKSHWPENLKYYIDKELVKTIHIPFKQVIIDEAIDKYSVHSPPSHTVTIFTAEFYEKHGIK